MCYNIEKKLTTITDFIQQMQQLQSKKSKCKYFTLTIEDKIFVPQLFLYGLKYLNRLNTSSLKINYKY